MVRAAGKWNASSAPEMHTNIRKKNPANAANNYIDLKSMHYECYLHHFWLCSSFQDDEWNDKKGEDFIWYIYLHK